MRNSYTEPSHLTLHREDCGGASLARLFTTIEEVSDVLCIHSGRGDYQLEISPSLQNFLQEPHDDVNLGRPLMDLVNTLIVIRRVSVQVTSSSMMTE